MVSNIFFLWSSVNLSVCFVSKCDNTILSFLGSMTLTYFEILFAFFMTLTAWSKLVFLQNCHEFPIMVVCY